MKRIKKIFAFALAMVMMLAMNVTVFADEINTNANATADIKVTNLVATGTNTVNYVKVLEPDVKAEGGYKFVEGVSVAKKVAEGEEPANYTVAELLALSAGDLQEALTRVNGGTAVSMTVTNDGKTAVATATVDAGLYAITATNSSNDVAIVYNNMAVSVEYDNATYVAASKSYVYDVKADQTKNVVVAKYTTIPVTKVSTDTDKVVGISDIVKYNIKTYIPSQVTKFSLTDVLTGATYLKDETHPVTVMIGGAEVSGTDSMVNGNLVIDLSSNLTGNEGKLVEVSYYVTVTATEVNNTVTPNDGKHTFDPASEKLFTGSITLTKYASDSDNIELSDNAKLAGAGFIVAKSVNNETSYATFTNNQLTGWVSVEENATVVTTDVNGEVTVSGLDAGTYNFIEVVAPTGYSINNAPATATLALASDATVATVALTATTYMIDTTLSALPSTGGIGTTIFTIAGVAIMVLAAGLFFVSRRKNAR